MRLGVIGLGFISRNWHLPAIGILRNLGWPIEIAALCDRSPDALGEAAKPFPEAAKFSDGERFLAEAEVDAVLIAIWPPESAQFTRRALEGGFHVLVEKPVSYSVEEFLELEQLVADGDRLVQVAYNRRWQPLAQRMRASLKKESLQYARAVFHRSGRDEAIFYPGNIGHPLDFLRSLLGDLECEACEWSDRASGRQVPAGANLSLRTAKGVPVQLDIRPDTGRVIEEYHLVFPGETWVLSYLVNANRACEPAYLEHWKGGECIRHAKTGPFEDIDSLLIARGFVHQMAAFVAGCKSGILRPGSPTLADARRVMEILQVAVRLDPSGKGMPG